MLQALSDLFLVISSDKKTITNKDLIVFYNFIIKKIPQIEQQFPSVISKSLSNNISSNLSEEKQIDITEYKKNKDNNTKKLFVYFQKQIFSLYCDLINFCFKEDIVKFDNESLRKKIITKIGLNSSKVNSNVQVDKQTQNFLINLIINNKVNCTIFPSDYIKFFNSEDATKKRIYAERFMKFIKHMIIIYKESKKHSHSKKINNTEKKVSNTERLIGFDNKQIECKDKLSFKNIKQLNEDITNKNISSSEKSIIMNNEADNSLEDDKEEVNDTISCSTPKNINSKKFFKKNELNKIYNKSTMSVSQTKNDIFNINFSSQRNTSFLQNQNKKINIINNKLTEKSHKDYQSSVYGKKESQNLNMNGANYFVYNNCLKKNDNYNIKDEENLVGCNIN